MEQSILVNYDKQVFQLSVGEALLEFEMADLYSSEYRL